jgi:cobalt-zinc-cadmium efflux system protein
VSGGHPHGGGHDYGGGTAARTRRRLGIVLALTASVLVVEVVGALLSGSLALLADAAHTFVDSASLVIALVVATLALRPATARCPHGRGSAS